jgi:hypothetical protein
MIVIYLIDARTVLNPRNEVDHDEDADWSCIGLFDQDTQSSDNLNTSRVQSEAGLDIVEIATVKLPAYDRCAQLTYRYADYHSGQTYYPFSPIPMP